MVGLLLCNEGMLGWKYKKGNLKKKLVIFFSEKLFNEEGKKNFRGKIFLWLYKF